MKIMKFLIVGLVFGLSGSAVAQSYITNVPDSFYILPPQESATTRTVVYRCGLSFGAVLTQTGMFVERNTPEVADLVEECILNGIWPTFSRECDLVAVQLEVDTIFVFMAQETRRGWLFDATAMSPDQYATVWRNQVLWEGERDGVLAALDACADLGLAYLSSQAPDALPETVSWRTGAVPTGASLPSERTATLEIIDITPAPVEVLVDGIPMGTVPGQIDVTPGAHLVTLRAPGCDEWTRRVRFREGEVKDLGEILLDQQTAVLEISSNVAGAEIGVDGRVVGRTQRDRSLLIEVSPAAWDLRIYREGYELFETTLLLSPGGRQRIHAELAAAGPMGERGRRAPNIPILGDESSALGADDEDWIMTLPPRDSEEEPAMSLPEEDPDEDDDLLYPLVPF